MTRLEANREILAILSDFIEGCTDQRFSQILVNLNIVEMDSLGTWRDEFYLESSKLLERVKYDE